MQSHDTTPRFRNLSINSTPRIVTSTFSFSDKIEEEHRDPEKECFMCRQANVYVQPIGMQQERRVARRLPPPLTRAQIDELCEKKHLTKREVRLLLQCYFPEIKNIKYFQLHKYHSCCYDPKHLNLCKNHITALQHEREQYPNHNHNHDHDHQTLYDKDNGQQNRVSFVRIKILPTKGIPTRFLGPTALPESLADMLIKQVNRFENKKRPISFNPPSQNALDMHSVRKVQQPYGSEMSRLSERLANIDSEDEDDDDDDDDDDNDDNSDEESEEDENQLNTPNGNIRGYHGKVTDRSRMNHEKNHEKPKHKKADASTNTNGDLVVEDLDELNHLFITEQKPSKPLKKKKRNKRNTKHFHTHNKPKLNHWEILALDQSKQEVCGCRHHVARLEADQVVYGWCRCKDHLHKDGRGRRKSFPPPAPPPSPPSKKPKIQKKTVGIDASEKTITELAVAYDPSTVEYDIIQETLYYRTTSGRLIKPEITNAFTYSDKSPSKGFGRHKSLIKKSAVISTTPNGQIRLFQNGEKRQRKKRLSGTDTPTSTNTGSVYNGQTLFDANLSSRNNRTDGLIPMYEIPNSLPTTTGGGGGGIYGNNDDSDSDSDDDQDGTAQFIPPKYVPELPVALPIPTIQSTIPMSMQKSSKPTFMNQKPTPNFDRESSLVANRRWFDQALGDQNLLTVQDGRYGLIAGTSSEQYLTTNEAPENDYVETDPQRNKSNCTIS